MLSEAVIQWAPTKLVHMTLGYTSVLCTSLVGAHCNYKVDQEITKNQAMM